MITFAGLAEDSGHHDRALLRLLFDFTKFDFLLKTDRTFGGAIGFFRDLFETPPGFKRPFPCQIMNCARHCSCPFASYRVRKYSDASAAAPAYMAVRWAELMVWS